MSPRQRQKRLSRNLLRRNLERFLPNFMSVETIGKDVLLFMPSPDIQASWHQASNRAGPARLKNA